MATASAPVTAARGTPRWLGVALLIAVALMADQKRRAGLLPEMLWACHPAAVLLSLGVLLARPRLAAPGGLLLICAGLPLWLFDVAVSHTTTWQSVLVHFIGAATGFLQFRRLGIPREARWIAFALYASLMVLCRFVTSLELNVNLAYGPYPGTHLPFAIWGSYGFNFALAVITLFGGDYLLRKTVARSR